MKGFYAAGAFCLLLCAAIITSPAAFAQTGPGGVGNNTGTSTLNLWFRADANITNVSGAVSVWGDASGYGNNLSQVTPANRPTVATNAALNNNPVVRYNAANSQFFTSSVNGPGVNNLTLFLVARGTSYQSLIRFQNTPGTFVVYPWELGSPARSFLTSSDGGTGAGIASGLLDNVNNIGAARYRINTATSGMQTFLNGAVNSQRSSVNSILPTQNLFSGKYNGGAEYPSCDVGEMIVYYSALNDAQMVIVQNYLAAKFNATLTANDVYKMDDNVNGDFDFEVAGIGRVNSTNLHNDSRGTSFIRILNPTDLNDGEYLLWGHNNLSASATNTSDIPSGVAARFNRVWRVSEATGDVGGIDIQIDITGLTDFTSLSTCDAASAMRLLVDTNNNGVFSDQTPILGATNIGGNIFRFANVSAIADGNRFTIAIVSPEVTGPGGVGGTIGTGNLALWMDAGKGITTASGVVTNWADQSGHSINAVPPTVAARPTYTASALNGQPVLGFATNKMLELSTNINTITPSMFMVANKTSAGTGYMTLLTLQQNLWLAQGNSADQWGMYVINDALSTTLNATYRVMSTLERNYNDIDLYDAETGVNRTNGTNFHGKAIGTIGCNNSGTTNSGLQFFNGNFGEIIVYSSIVNSAQRIIISNYLAAKYGLTLAAASDVYTRDNPANGNFDFEVAGIGRVNSTNLHNDAKGSGLIRISNPASLDDGDYFMWGHNNLPALPTSDLPSGIQSRWNREWSVSETGDVGAIDMQFDLSTQGPVTASDLRLLIDHDGDGIYNEGGTIIVSGATALSCNTYIFTGVGSIADGMRFTMGSVNSAQTALPIELVAFEGTMKDGVTELTWETASEFNNDYFTVERSQSGEKFTRLFNVKGAGKSTTTRFYAAVDNTTPVGILYYRLKQTDFDGATSYSKVIVVNNNDPRPVFNVSPNPVKMGDDINVRISNLTHDANVEIAIYDILGRPIPITHDQSNNIWKVSTAIIRSPGIYILKLTTENSSRMERIYISE